MGFYTKYFSTLLKGVWATAFKERIETRRLINNLNKADHLLYKSIFEDVDKKHRVTKAIREEKKLLGELKKSVENAYSLIFNLSTEEITLLKAVEDILKELEAFSKSVPPNPQLKKVERELVLTIFEAVKKDEQEEREEYKQVMLVVNESEKVDSIFMQKVKLIFQKETAQTLLAKWAMRSAIRKAKVDILKLQKIPIMIKALRRRLTEKGKKESVDKVIGELYGTIQEIKKYCKDAFYELYLLQKRDLIITLKILVDLDNLKLFNENWVGKHNMPKDPTEEKNKEILDIEKKISSEFRTIAQSFRIIISKIQELEKEAQIDASRA